MKMICRILLLLSLTSCVCGTLVVNVTQSSYQAEENHNITLEWTFTTTSDSSIRSLIIFCQLVTEHSVSVLFRLRGGVEVSESQDQQFVGRVQWDKDVLREGRVRLHVSRLRTEDSGWYHCEVKRNDDRSAADCWLRVTAGDSHEPAVSDYPELSDHFETPIAASAGGIIVISGVIIVIGALTAAVLLAVVVVCYLTSRQTRGDTGVALKSPHTETGDSDSYSKNLRLDLDSQSIDSFPYF